MKTSDSDRLYKIVTTWDDLKKQIEANGITRDRLLNSQFFQWAVTTPLYNIGEHVYYLSPELKARYPDVPWSLVAGLRHRLVHDYEGINWSIIVEVIFENMEPFVSRVSEILSEIR